MSISSLRVALLNFIISKQLNEDLLIRMDDTNKEENIEGKDKEILEILSLFSMDYKGVVYQSENLKYHQKMVMQLMAQKKAFACFCSNEKLKELKETAKKESKPNHYDGFCATLSDETVLNCNAPFTVRFKKPMADIHFTDTLKGKFSYKPSDVNSFIVLNHDKTPTANYACAVDDMLYNISTVIREDIHFNNTVEQVHIRQSLGYEKEINYIHVPSLLDEKTYTVKELIDEGFLPSAIANYLVSLGMKTPSETFTLEEAINWFDIEKLSNNVEVFDIEKLKTINQEHLSSMDEMRLSKILGFADSDIGKLGKLYLTQCSTIKEIKSKIDLIFTAKKSFKEFENELTQIKECLSQAPYYDTVDELMHYITEKTGLTEDKVIKPLEYLITGQNNGPKLSDIYPFIKNYLGEIVK